MVSGYWITSRTYSFLSSLLFLGCLSFHFFSSQFPTELTPAWGMAGPTPHSLLYSVSEKAEIVKEGNRYMKVHYCQNVALNMSAKLENSAVATRLIRVVFIPNPNKDNAKECSVQFSHSVVSDSATPWTVARQAFLSITNSWSLLKLMSIESVMPSNHLILCRPLLLPSSIFPSMRVFSIESVLCIRWPKNVQTTKKLCSFTC